MLYWNTLLKQGVGTPSQGVDGETGGVIDGVTGGGVRDGVTDGETGGGVMDGVTESEGEGPHGYEGRHRAQLSSEP